MHYYRINPADLAQRGTFGPMPHAAVVLVDPDSGDVLVRSPTALPDLPQSTKRAFDEAEARQAALAAAAPRLLATDLHATPSWRVEPSSGRRATLTAALSPTGGAALRIEFGGGKGDTIRVGRPLRVPAAATALRLAARSLLPEGESLSIGAVLTTEAERPWLEIAAQEVAPGGARELTLDLSGLDEKRRARADRLVLVVVSDADSGAVLVDRLALIA